MLLQLMCCNILFVPAVCSCYLCMLFVTVCACCREKALPWNSAHGLGPKLDGIAWLTVCSTAAPSFCASTSLEHITFRFANTACRQHMNFRYEPWCVKLCCCMRLIHNTQATHSLLRSSFSSLQYLLPWQTLHMHIFAACLANHACAQPACGYRAPVMMP